MDEAELLLAQELDLALCNLHAAGSNSQRPAAIELWRGLADQLKTCGTWALVLPAISGNDCSALSLSAVLARLQDHTPLRHKKRPTPHTGLPSRSEACQGHLALGVCREIEHWVLASRKVTEAEWAHALWPVLSGLEALAAGRLPVLDRQLRAFWVGCSAALLGCEVTHVALGVADVAGHLELLHRAQGVLDVVLAKAGCADEQVVRARPFPGVPLHCNASKLLSVPPHCRFYPTSSHPENPPPTALNTGCRAHGV